MNSQEKTCLANARTIISEVKLTAHGYTVTKVVPKSWCALCQSIVLTKTLLHIDPSLTMVEIRGKATPIQDLSLLHNKPINELYPVSGQMSSYKTVAALEGAREKSVKKAANANL